MITSPFMSNWDYVLNQAPGSTYRSEEVNYLKSHLGGADNERPLLLIQPTEGSYWNQLQKNWAETCFNSNAYYALSITTDIKNDPDPTKSWEYMHIDNWDSVKASFATILNYMKTYPNYLIQPDSLTLSIYSDPEFDMLPTSSNGFWVGWTEVPIATFIDYYSRVINWLWDNYVPLGGSLRFHLSPYLYAVLPADSTTYTNFYNLTLAFLNGVATNVNQASKNIYITCAPQDGCGYNYTPLNAPPQFGARNPRPGHDSDGSYAKLLLCYNAHYNAFVASSQSAKNRARANIECNDFDVSPAEMTEFNDRFINQIERTYPYTQYGFVTWSWINTAGYGAFKTDYNTYYFNSVPSTVAWINS